MRILTTDVEQEKSKDVYFYLCQTFFSDGGHIRTQKVYKR